jgi:UDP-N-acetylmuramyl pentapeptide phosphotransferase/UDP-N-acetylglucosamine-1-phosphate transferase
LVGIIFLVLRHVLVKDNTRLYFSFGEIELGVFYYPIMLFIILGIVNCANLTDGVDGLATSTALAIAVSIFYLSLDISYIPEPPNIDLIGMSSPTIVNTPLTGELVTFEAKSSVNGPSETFTVLVASGLKNCPIGD